MVMSTYMNQLIADLSEDRRKWHRPIAGVSDEICEHCGKPLAELIDEINGLILACETPHCPGRY